MPDSRLVLILSEILETHLIAFSAEGERTTVHLISKDDKVDYAITMPTLEEALAMAFGTRQRTRDCIEVLPIQLEAA